MGRAIKETPSLIKIISPLLHSSLKIPKHYLSSQKLCRWEKKQWITIMPNTFWITGYKERNPSDSFVIEAHRYCNNTVTLIRQEIASFSRARNYKKQCVITHDLIPCKPSKDWIIWGKSEGRSDEWKVRKPTKIKKKKKQQGLCIVIPDRHATIVQAGLKTTLWYTSVWQLINFRKSCAPYIYDIMNCGLN